MFSLMTPRVQGPTHICSKQKCLTNPTRNVIVGLFTKSKHPSWKIQKIMIVPEHLLQNLEKENCLTSPPQLTTFTRFLHIFVSKQPFFGLRLLLLQCGVWFLGELFLTNTTNKFLSAAFPFESRVLCHYYIPANSPAFPGVS